MTEPTLYQYRVRSTWYPNTHWSDWKECDQTIYNQHTETPLIQDWMYETRKLFAEPYDIEPPRFAKRLIEQLRDVVTTQAARIDQAALQCELATRKCDSKVIERAFLEIKHTLLK